MKLINETNPKLRSGSKRKTLVLILAAAIALVTFTGAGVYTRWSRTAQHRYTPSEEIKAQAEDSGLSEILEEKKELSVTDQGITVTAVQSLIDEEGGEITFRIEGLEVPDGRFPATDFENFTITIDGSPFFKDIAGAGFFDGTTFNEKGERVYAYDGKPVESDESAPYQPVILKPVAPDGSLEFTYYFHKSDKFGELNGKEICVTFTAFGLESEQKLGDPEFTKKGNWTLKWKISASSNYITVKPNAKIGDSDVRLLEARIGELSIHTTYQLQEELEGFDEMAFLPEAVQGVRLKDGSEYICVPSSEGYVDREKLIYFVDATMYNGILDLKQVESLMFHKGWDGDTETFYYIPVK